MYVIAAIVIINLIGIANASANGINNPAPSEGLSGLQVAGAFILMMAIMLKRCLSRKILQARMINGP